MRSIQSGIFGNIFTGRAADQRILQENINKITAVRLDSPLERIKRFRESGRYKREGEISRYNEKVFSRVIREFQGDL